jgi:hypothetical protein
VIYDVRANNFIDFVGMQYSIVYEADKLSFVSLQNLNLPDLDQGDFNPSEPGIIRNVWIQTALTGVTLPEGGLLYQIVFQRSGTETGDVCFSEDPLEYEFINPQGDLASFLIQDDCHSSPFQIFLTVSVDELAEMYGLRLSTKSSGGHLAYSLDQPQSLQFRLLDLSGKVLTRFPNEDWLAGPHTQQLGKSYTPGIYLLHIRTTDQDVAVKVLLQE